MIVKIIDLKSNVKQTKKIYIYKTTLLYSYFPFLLKKKKALFTLV